jgi:hypothetical protein
MKPWSGSEQWQEAGYCECGNETPGSIKFRNFLTSRRPISFQEGRSSMELGVMLSHIGRLLLFSIQNFRYSGACYNERCYNEHFYQ